MAVNQPAHLLPVVKARKYLGLDAPRRVMLHSEPCWSPSWPSPSDTARQWSSFAPQKQRCLHGREAQPLKALLDAGNEVAEDQSEEEQVMEAGDWVH